MGRAIEKAAVIGAGVMGAGIAAHLANAGLPVVLLDIVPKGAKNRDVVAETAVAKLLKADPAPLMHKRNAKRIATGNVEDHLDRLADCDLIVEAVIEDAAIKRDLYARIEKVRKPGSIVSSNTSTIPLSLLTEGLPERFARDFVVTHFFNPPRYMRLLEIVGGPQTDRSVLEAVREFGDVRLGKAVVECKDTPGFIANRIGALWIAGAIRHAEDLGLAVEEADAVAGRPMGFPKTGVFGLLDLVGLDLGPHVARSLLATLPEGDAYRSVYRESPLMMKMIADGYTGRKGKGGFYRLNREGGAKVKEAIDLATGNYRPTVRASLESLSAGRTSLRALVEHPDRGGRYAWAMLADTLAYAASLVPEIADGPADVDEAMRNGYAWKWGPFELIDRLGPKWFADRLRADGRAVPPLLDAVGDGTFYRVESGRLQVFGADGSHGDVTRPRGVLLLSDLKRAGAPLAKNGSASLWDIGDGVACLEFHTKMNSLDPGVLAMLAKAMKIIPKRGMRALVIHNEGSNFSVGANVGLALFATNIAAWAEVENMLGQGQDAYQALKHAPFPVVGAPSGMALGGGCEILLHCDAVVAHAETYMGLVEVGVGVVPAWGGCKEMLLRWSQNRKYYQGPMPAAAKVFEMVSTATVAKSADEARDCLFLRPDDTIVMNRDRLLATAKARALELAQGYVPPKKHEVRLPGPTGLSAFTLAVDDFRRMGKATAHDVTVSLALGRVLSGGDVDITETVSEDAILGLERDAFMALLKTPETLARIEHMLETGKPLRN